MRTIFSVTSYPPKYIVQLSSSLFAMLNANNGGTAFPIILYASDADTDEFPFFLGIINS